MFRSRYKFYLDSRSGCSGQGTALLQRVCRERCNKGFGGVGLVLPHFV
jgi:hypothetical protein